MIASFVTLHLQQRTNPFWTCPPEKIYIFFSFFLFRWWFYAENSKTVDSVSIFFFFFFNGQQSLIIGNVPHLAIKIVKEETFMSHKKRREMKKTKEDGLLFETAWSIVISRIVWGFIFFFFSSYNFLHSLKDKNTHRIFLFTERVSKNRENYWQILIFTGLEKKKKNHHKLVDSKKNFWYYSQFYDFFLICSSIGVNKKNFVSTLLKNIKNILTGKNEKKNLLAK